MERLTVVKTTDDERQPPHHRRSCANYLGDGFGVGNGTSTRIEAAGGGADIGK
jgi:hypothetical protein